MKAAAVMLLGTFRFDNPGLDHYKPAHHQDMLSPQKQREVAEVLDRLAAFAPQRIGVERRRERQPELDAAYAEYQAGRLTLPANEIHQLGFRLAARLGHPRVHAIDADGRVNQADYDALERYAREHGEQGLLMDESPWYTDHFRRIFERHNELQATQTLREHLLCQNDPANVLTGHGIYLVGLFEIGGERDDTGPDFVTDWWYSRNLRIFRNIQRICYPAVDRILVIIGSGHLPILRHCLEASPTHTLVEVAAYLG